MSWSWIRGLIGFFLFLVETIEERGMRNQEYQQCSIVFAALFLISAGQTEEVIERMVRFTKLRSVDSGEEIMAVRI